VKQNIATLRAQGVVFFKLYLSAGLDAASAAFADIKSSPLQKVTTARAIRLKLRQRRAAPRGVKPLT
jgi:hypothetical protein